MTVEKIIENYLAILTKGGKAVIGTHRFQTELVDYGRIYYGKLHTPETYVRGWRSFKNKTNKFSIQEVKMPFKTKEKHYEVYAKI